MKNKTYIFKPLLLTALLAFSIPSLHADSDGVIIASKDVNVEKLSKNELERIFLGKTTIWDNGTRIQVGLSNSDDQKIEAFLKNSIGKNKRRFKKYWLKLVFAGYGIAPKFFKNDEKAIKYIKKQEGVIAFISTKDIKDVEGFKVISID